MIQIEASFDALCDQAPETVDFYAACASRAAQRFGIEDEGPRATFMAGYVQACSTQFALLSLSKVIDRCLVDLTAVIDYAASNMNKK